jgi:hypothetical protein
VTYASVADVVVILGTSPSGDRLVALERILEAMQVEVDAFLDLDPTVPLPDPAPAAVVQAHAQASADVYISQATRGSNVDSGDPDLSVIAPPRDPLRSVEHLLAPYARAHGVG